jgi:hypothetical protein
MVFGYGTHFIIVIKGNGIQSQSKYTGLGGQVSPNAKHQCILAQIELIDVEF